MAEQDVAARPLPINPASGRAAPYWLPASHFATGLVFLSAAALLLPGAATDLAAGRFLQPRVVAVTHLITLGWLTISIMGALCQLFPVLLGTPLRWIRVSVATLALFVPGLGVFVVGLLAGRTTLTIAGALLFASALVLFVVNAVATLWRATRRDLTWWTLAAAFFFLLATITFGISLAINLRSGHLGTGRLTALMVHVHVALGGWVLLVIMAAARRLLPMFLLSHGTKEGPLRIAVATMVTGVLILTVFHQWMTPGLMIAAAVLMMVSVGALAVQIVSYVRTRHRPELDAGLRLLLSGGVFVLSALLIGIALLATGNGALIAGYGVAAVGGLALFVAGHYYKILPFLLWNHRFAPLVGKRPLPKISELYDARLANVASGASIAGCALFLASVLLGAQAAAAGGAMLLGSGLIIEAVQLINLLNTRVE